MRQVKMMVLGLIIGFCVVITGCGGGGAEVKSTNTTMGQELQDLKKTLDQGIITEKEYNRAKKDILKKYD